MSRIPMEPIGIVHSSRTAVEDDHWDREQAFIELGEKKGVKEGGQEGVRVRRGKGVREGGQVPLSNKGT